MIYCEVEIFIIHITCREKIVVCLGFIVFLFWIGIIFVHVLLLKKFMFLMWQIYAEMIGNVMIDARSTGKYYHCKYTSIEVKNHGTVIHHITVLCHQGNQFCLFGVVIYSMAKSSSEWIKIIIP